VSDRQNPDSEETAKAAIYTAGSALGGAIGTTATVKAVALCGCGASAGATSCAIGSSCGAVAGGGVGAAVVNGALAFAAANPAVMVGIGVAAGGYGAYRLVRWLF
jgi:hypothetical protein